MMKKIIILLLICFGLFLYLKWGNQSIRTTQHVYRNKNITGSAEGMRIVQVSDLQSQYFGKEQRALLKAVADAEPDIIVVTGDLLDRNHTDYEASITAAEGLAAIAPVYYVNGNHELALPVSEVDDFYRALEEAGVHLLFNRGEMIETAEQNIYIGGIWEETLYAAKTGSSEIDTANMGRGKVSDTDIDGSVICRAMEQTFADAPEGALRIMLVHEPQFLETYGMGPADLIFAGHAHGGQIRLPFTQGLFAPGQGILPKLTSGVHESGDAKMVISRGLGNSVFPIRLFNRPEIIVAVLEDGNI